MICIQILALTLLFISTVYGVEESCLVDEHCGSGEKCLTLQNARYPFWKICKRPCRGTSECKWWKGEKCRKKHHEYLGYCAKGWQDKPK